MEVLSQPFQVPLVEELHLHVRIPRAQLAQLPVLARHERLLHDGQLDVEILVGKVEIGRERLEHAAVLVLLEHEGDRITHEIVDLVNRTFVTPFDRDDMYRLAGALDDVCDHVDDAAAKVVDYGVREIRQAAKDQALVIEKAALKLTEAVARLE